MNLSTIIDFQDHCTPRTPLQDSWRSVCLCRDIFGSVWDTLHYGRVARWGKHSFIICWTHEIGQISRTAAWRPPAASVPTALRTWPKETRVDRPKTTYWSTVDLRALICMTYSVRHIYISCLSVLTAEPLILCSLRKLLSGWSLELRKVPLLHYRHDGGRILRPGNRESTVAVCAGEHAKCVRSIVDWQKSTSKCLW